LPDPAVCALLSFPPRRSSDLTSEPLFVLATCAVAAVGLAGLTRLPKVWTAILLLGIAVMGIKLGFYLDFLDGPGAIEEVEIKARSEEHTSELQSRFDLVCRRL